MEPRLPPLGVEEAVAAEEKTRQRYAEDWKAVTGGGKRTSRPRQRGNKRKKQPPMFSHFSLNKDPEVSKYMPYDEVAYPKLERIKPGPRAREELDTMWMVGFLDDVDRNEGTVEKESLAPYIQLPGEGLLPFARRELKKAERRREVEIEKDAMYSPRFQGFLQEDAKAGDRSSENYHKALTKEERLALDALAKQVEDRRERGKSDKIMDVYRKENRKIRRVLEGRRPKQKKATVASNHMINLFERTRAETQATIVLQRGWRRFVIRRFWRLRLAQMVFVKRIQALARGFITRRLVAQWYQHRIYMTVRWQARMRKFLDLKHWRARHAVEIAMCPKIQRIIRGFLGRRRFDYLLRVQAAVHIQCLWRGCVGRAVADRLWVEPKLVKMQALVRGMLGRRGLTTQYTEHTALASMIQRCWRGFWARRVRNDKLFDRETRYRQDLIAELSSENAYWTDQRDMLQRRLDKRSLNQRVEDLMVAGEELNSHIRELEMNWIELQRQKQIVSPRALQQGWREELIDNIKEHRQLLTKHKLSYLFDHSLVRQRLEGEREKRAAAIHEAAFMAQKTEQWREEEIQANIDRMNKEQHEEDTSKKKKLIADQRRKWTIRFFTASGKPDKKRRPGKPWDASAFAGQERDVFCGGAVDIHAFNKSVERLRMGSDESLQRIMTKIQTQNFINEVQSMDAMLAPLVRPLQQRQHDPPAWKEREQLDTPVEGMPWLPTPLEMGVKPVSEIMPPPDPTRPPYLRGYPSPTLVQNREAAEARAKAEISKEEAAAAAAENMPDERSAEGPGRVQGAETDGASTASSSILRRKRRHRPVVTRIPWSLLDELEHEKYKLKAEKAIHMAFDK